jgi:hypothetical protein
MTDMHLLNTAKKLKTLAAAVKQADFIKGYFEEARAKGETLDMETHKFRSTVLKAFLESGTPLS